MTTKAAALRIAQRMAETIEAAPGREPELLELCIFFLWCAEQYDG